MSNALMRELVLNQALKVTPFTYLDNTFYVKELDVGTMNYIQRKLRQIKIKLAEAQDIYLDEDDPEQFNEAINRVYDEYDVARMLAFKLCDEKGELLFDAENEEDLKGLNRLGQGFSNAVFTAEAGNSEKTWRTATIPTDIVAGSWKNARRNRANARKPLV